MAELGLRPGPWLKQLKDPADAAKHVHIDGSPHAKQDLLRELLVETPGDSVAYLSDFLLDDAAQERLALFLRGCGTIVCESQYLAADIELARKHYHMTSVQAAELARRADARDLILFHVSSRYDRGGWRTLLDEARVIFPRARFSESWNLNGA